MCDLVIYKHRIVYGVEYWNSRIVYGHTWHQMSIVEPSGIKDHKTQCHALLWFEHSNTYKFLKYHFLLLFTTLVKTLGLLVAHQNFWQTKKERIFPSRLFNPYAVYVVWIYSGIMQTVEFPALCKLSHIIKTPNLFNCIYLQNCSVKFSKSPLLRTNLAGPQKYPQIHTFLYPVCFHAVYMYVSMNI